MNLSMRLDDEERNISILALEYLKSNVQLNPENFVNPNQLVDQSTSLLQRFESIQHDINQKVG